MEPKLSKTLQKSLDILETLVPNASDIVRRDQEGSYTKDMRVLFQKINRACWTFAENLPKGSNKRSKQNVETAKERLVACGIIDLLREVIVKGLESYDTTSSDTTGNSPLGVAMDVLSDTFGGSRKWFRTTVTYTSVHVELWCRVRDDDSLLSVLLKTLKEWYRPHMDNTTTESQNKILTRSLKIICNTAQLDDTATIDRLRQLGTTDVLVNYLNSADSDNVFHAARSLGVIVTEQEADNLAAGDLCTGFCKVVGKKLCSAATDLTKNLVICRILEKEGSGVSAVMEKVRLTSNSFYDTLVWLRVLSSMCTSDQVMPPAMRKEALDLAVTVYRSKKENDGFDTERRDNARKILEALRDDLERTPEYKQLCSELGFKPEDGGRERRPSLEDTQRTAGSPERQHTQAFRTSHVSASPFFHTPTYSAQQTASPLQQIPDSPSQSVHVPAATVFSDEDDINVDSTMSDTPGVHVSCNDQASSSRELRDQHNKHEDGERELGERPSHCEVEQSDRQRADEKQAPGKKKRRRQTETRKQQEEEHTRDPTAPSAMRDSGPRPEDEARRLDKKLKRAMIKSRNGEESRVDTGTTKDSGRRPEDGTPQKRAKKNSKTGEGSSIGTRTMKDSGCRSQSGSPQKRAKKTSKNDEERSVGTRTMKDSGRRLHDETRRLDKKPKRAKTNSRNGEESSVGAEREIQDGTQNLDDVEGGTTEAELQGKRKRFSDRHKELETRHKKDQEIINTLQDKIKELEDTVQNLQKTNKKLEDSLRKQRNEAEAREGVIRQETDEDAKEYKQWRKKTRELEEEHRKYREKNRKLDEECQRYRDKTRQLEEERREYTERSRQLVHSTSSEDTAGTSRAPSKPRKPAVYTTSESEATAFGMVCLTSDHDVFIHEDKLQIAVNGAKSRRVPCDGTKLARRLIKLFFTQTERERGSISTDPKDGLQELNPEITKAIIDYCLAKDNTTSRGKVRNSMASLLTAERCRARNQTAKRSKGKKVAKKTAAGTD